MEAAGCRGDGGGGVPDRNRSSGPPEGLPAGKDQGLGTVAHCVSNVFDQKIAIGKSFN